MFQITIQSNGTFKITIEDCAHMYVNPSPVQGNLKTV